MRAQSLILRIKSLPPEKLFWLFALSHVFLWTFIPTLLSPNAPLDVIEGYAWGREWLLGTYKHPPMQAWWLEILAFLTIRSNWAHFFASQIAILMAFWAVWKTGLEIFNAKASLIGVLLLESIFYYNYTSPEFNPNVLQIAFWALIGCSFYKAVKYNHLHDWMLLGLWSACGLYSKYFTFLFLAILGLFMIVQPDARRRLLTKGPYVSFAIGFILFLPHLIWLIEHDFLPLVYTQQRLDLTQQAHISYLPIRFAFKQIMVLLPLLFLVLSLYGFKKRKWKLDITSFDWMFLSFVTIGPLVLTCLVSAVLNFKLKSMWGSPFWNFSGLYVLSWLSKQELKKIPGRFMVIWFAVFMAFLAGFAATNSFQPYVTHIVKRIHFPGKALAQEITAAWHNRFDTSLSYIIGDTWVAGNVAYYAPERPHVFIDANKTISPWIDLNRLQDKGAVYVWAICLDKCTAESDLDAEENMKTILSTYPNVELQQPFFLRPQTDANMPLIKVYWAIIPPYKREE